MIQQRQKPIILIRVGRCAATAHNRTPGQDHNGGDQNTGVVDDVSEHGSGIHSLESNA
ncbi:MAG: hypothetical protein PHQ28_06225 [Mycobacterium sp.]|nr:hypothetical protein [Mycobacterium sp.]